MLIVRHTHRKTSYFRLRLTEWLLSAEVLAFGLALVGRFPLFQLSAEYRVMAGIATQHVWAIAFLACGALRLVTLAINGLIPVFRRWSPFVRLGLCTMSAGLWSAYCVGALTSPYPSPTTLTYTLLFAGELIISVGIAREAGEAEQKYRNACGK